MFNLGAIIPITVHVSKFLFCISPHGITIITLTKWKTEVWLVGHLFVMLLTTWYSYFKLVFRKKIKPDVKI